MKLMIIRPKRLADARGWFSETWNKSRLEAEGIAIDFCQDNHSLSQDKGTIRGLHFQTPPYAQTKLVRCLRGRIFDVAVDIRRSSPTYGHWAGVELTAENGKQLLIPKGYAHGFLTLEPDCEIAYKVDAYYSAENDGGIAWNDAIIGIDWPLDVLDPMLSEKDARLPSLRELSVDFPYDGQPMKPIKELVV